MSSVNFHKLRFSHLKLLYRNRDANDKKGTRGTKRCVNWQMSVKTGGDDNQYQLDAGQMRFGATQCTECGVVYQLGDPQDENAHLNYHNSIKILKVSCE